MPQTRRTFSVCIPAYNRARHLPALLDSVFSQDFTDFDIVICEDNSPERAQIAAVVADYARRFPGQLHYSENETNLGYDANIRRLVEKATGHFCFFMGNDDVMCPRALSAAADIVARYPDVGLILKSYAWFDDVPGKINQEVRYFSEETCLAAGRDAISVCFRRSGVISGYIIRRDPAQAAATDRYDGSLYYQMHLTASVLAGNPAVATPQVLVLCRNGEPPEFGNSEKEKGKYVPGHYTPEARLRMVSSAIGIIRDFSTQGGPDVADVVMRDYANYFYPYIKDQLQLPFRQYFSLYRAFGRMGFSRFPMFHVYFLVAYALGESGFDRLTAWARRVLGRSPHFGITRRGS